MTAAWAIALGADSPVLAVPWCDNDGGDDGRAAYVDLRAHPERIGEIPEARENPVLAHVLARLNAPESPWATAKCDRWNSMKTICRRPRLTWILIGTICAGRHRLVHRPLSSGRGEVRLARRSPRSIRAADAGSGAEWAFSGDAGADAAALHCGGRGRLCYHRVPACRR